MNHSWNLTPKEAVALQKELREKIQLISFTAPIRHIGGCDVSMNRFSKHVFAGFVVLSYPSLEVVDTAVIEDDITFPYIPGLLSFREIPSLLKAWEKLRIVPDLVCVDGVGIAHPRRMGIATHLGLALDIPTIGISKSLLTGTYEEVGNEQGSTSPLLDIKNPHEVLGVALRTKQNVKPVFVSPGHKMVTEDAVSIVKACMGKYRIPEPTRMAHNVVNEYRKKANTE
jgi:deoxyribonuclease V